MNAKKHLKLVCALLGALSLYGCRVTTPQTYTAGNVLCSNYTGEPESTLQVDLIHAMTKGYRDYQLSYIKPNMKDTLDAHSIWFDLVTLKKFLYHLEMNTKANDASNSITDQDLGVRIYYANYPDRSTWGTRYKDLTSFVGNTRTKEYERLHTVVMVPTIRRDKVNIDFNPMDSTTFVKGMKEDTLYGPTSTASIPAVTYIRSGGQGSGGTSTASQNHGSLIPPGLSGGENFGDQ